MTGLFITLEGGDGSGKTTQAAALTAWLEERGETVVRTREPGGTPVGVQIREIVLHHRGEIDPRAEALLYAADRAQHVGTHVRPALAAGSVVVQDRYIDSSVAYQGAGRVLDAEEVRRLSAWATQELRPDLTVLLDLPQDRARERLDAAQKRFDRLEAEKAEFHERVRDAFLAIAEADPDRFLVLDAGLPVAELAARVRARVEPMLAPAADVGGRD